MDDASAAVQDFFKHLKQHTIPHWVVRGTLHVQGSLRIQDPNITAFPDDLTILGSLNMSGSRVQALPERLRVQGDLLMSRTAITGLPQGLAVEGTLSAAYAPVATLPENFRIPGGLDLESTPIASLPKGLDIAMDLHLRNTAVVRFPTDLRVGGRIEPPEGLEDMVAFMDTTAPIRTIPYPGSAHQRMRLRDAMRPFPDLWRVVCSIPEGHQLRIEKLMNGGCATTMERRTA